MLQDKCHCKNVKPAEESPKNLCHFVIMLKNESYFSLPFNGKKSIPFLKT